MPPIMQRMIQQAGYKIPSFFRQLRLVMFDTMRVNGAATLKGWPGPLTMRLEDYDGYKQSCTVSASGVGLTSAPL